MNSVFCSLPFFHGTDAVVPSHALQILITNVLRGDADETERAEYDKKFADDERFRTLVEQIRGWLGPLEVKEEQNGPRPELLRSILDEIDASEKEK